MKGFIRNLPQIVPDSWCQQCRICCRFPDTEQVQTPVWAPLEARWAKEAGGDGSWFQGEKGSPSLSPRLKSCKEGGFRCPAFDPTANRCSIHSVKPLDCRLYPFVLAQNSAGTEVLLTMDTKCPFIQAHQTDSKLASYAMGLVEYLDNPIGHAYLKQNPKIIGSFWPEYVSVGGLPGATRLLQGEGPPEPPHPALSLLTRDQEVKLCEALSRQEHRASHYTLAGLLGWSDLIRIWWAPLRDAVALFAQQAGGLFMPVPPLQGSLTSEAIREAWNILTQVNSGSGVSRIEGIEPADRPLFEQLGFSVRATEKEYLYRMEDLAHLRGDRYRSQRWAVNRCQRAVSYLFRPFEEKDLIPCLQLYTLWAIRRQRDSQEDPMEKRLVRDGLFFHRRLMMDWQRFGLVGRVLEVNGEVRAYTFGAPVSQRIFCVFLEIADRSVPGLAQTLFWEFSRELEGRYVWLNAMGDCGLPRLQRAKATYRPAQFALTTTAEWS